MAKKILVLTGSPRQGGNSDQMADAFIRGAEQNGHTAVKFETALKNIDWCTACNRCWEGGWGCVYDDDFHRELEPLMESYDVLVFASPVWWMGFPASLKAVIDKFYVYGDDNRLRSASIKETMLLLCGGDPAPTQYDYIAQGYRSNVSYLGWQDRGFLWVGNVIDPGTIPAEALQKVEQLAKSL